MQKRKLRSAGVEVWALDLAEWGCRIFTADGMMTNRLKPFTRSFIEYYVLRNSRYDYSVPFELSESYFQ
jgi:hypothetical protein